MLIFNYSYGDQHSIEHIGLYLNSYQATHKVSNNVAAVSFVFSLVLPLK